MSLARSAAEEAVDLVANTCCFVAGTLVSTKSGLERIERLRVGDLVLSRDPVAGLTAFKPIMELIRRHRRQVYEVTLLTQRQDRSFHREIFKTTDDHPWRSSDGRWIQTIALVTGTQLLRAKGLPSKVVSVHRTERFSLTYNIEVADFHTYFVGRDQVWVHNAGCKDPLQNHHITPKYLGGPKNGPTVPLRRSYHQMITNAFRQLWKYGQAPPSKEKLKSIMKEVYRKFPLP